MKRLLAFVLLWPVWLLCKLADVVMVPREEVPHLKDARGWYSHPEGPWN